MLGSWHIDSFKDSCKTNCVYLLILCLGFMTFYLIIICYLLSAVRWDGWISPLLREIIFCSVLMPQPIGKLNSQGLSVPEDYNPSPPSPLPPFEWREAHRAEGCNSQVSRQWWPCCKGDQARAALRIFPLIIFSRRASAPPRPRPCPPAPPRPCSCPCPPPRPAAKVIRQGLPRESLL